MPIIISSEYIEHTFEHLHLSPKWLLFWVYFPTHDLLVPKLHINAIIPYIIITVCIICVCYIIICCMHFYSVLRTDCIYAVTDFIFLGSKITADGNCSHERKRSLLLGRKGMINLESVLKSRDLTLPTKS